jgi:hypothetical protein
VLLQCSVVCFHGGSIDNKVHDILIYVFSMECRMPGYMFFFCMVILLFPFELNASYILYRPYFAAHYLCAYFCSGNLCESYLERKKKNCVRVNRIKKQWRPRMQSPQPDNYFCNSWSFPAGRKRRKKLRKNGGKPPPTWSSISMEKTLKSCLSPASAQWTWGRRGWVGPTYQRE